MNLRFLRGRNMYLLVFYQGFKKEARSWWSPLTLVLLSFFRKRKRPGTTGWNDWRKKTVRGNLKRWGILLKMDTVFSTCFSVCMTTSMASWGIGLAAKHCLSFTQPTILGFTQIVYDYNSIHKAFRVKLINKEYHSMSTVNTRFFNLSQR